jgi:hypothetical protein
MMNKFFRTMLFIVIAVFCNANVFPQALERPRPVEWNDLVHGARFLDRFLPMPKGMSDAVWGARGHGEWPNSNVFHTVSDNPIGPFKINNIIGKGHNLEVFCTRNGQYVLFDQELTVI